MKAKVLGVLTLSGIAPMALAALIDAMTVNVPIWASCAATFALMVMGFIVMGNMATERK